MTYSIGLISDTHSTVGPLREALKLFADKNVDQIICAGDIAGYGDDELAETIELLRKHSCHLIAGNHDTPAELGELTESHKQFFNNLPLTLEFEIEGKKIYVVHAEPPQEQHGGIKLLDPDGNIMPERVEYWESVLADNDYDILIVGHTHQVFSKEISNTLVINPGSTRYNHTCMILELPSMNTTIYPLSGMLPILTWNWGKFYQEQQTQS